MELRVEALRMRVREWRSVFHNSHSLSPTPIQSGAGFRFGNFGSALPKPQPISTQTNTRWRREPTPLHHTSLPNPIRITHQCYSYGTKKGYAYNFYPVQPLTEISSNFVSEAPVNQVNLLFLLCYFLIHEAILAIILLYILFSYLEFGHSCFF